MGALAQRLVECEIISDYAPIGSILAAVRL
jgi:hypothetical protein